MIGRIASAFSSFFRNFGGDIRFLLVLAWKILFSLVGLFALRLSFSLIDDLVRLIGFEFTSWHGPFGAPTPTSSLILSLWFVGFLVLSFWCWVTVWCFGDSSIHWLPVLLLCVLVGAPSVYAMAQIGLQWVVLIPFIPVAFCLLMVAKLLGFNRFGRWLGGKGRWWRRNVLWPWVKIPAIGLVVWFILLLVFRLIIPSGHAWLLNDAGDWLVHWLWEPFWGAILFVFHSAVQAMHG